MRLFAAITVPPEATAEIEAAVAPLRPSWPGMSWADPGHWHLTLTFLDEVTGSLLPELAAGLRSAAREHPAAVLSVRGAGAFPDPASGRVLWAGCTRRPAPGRHHSPRSQLRSRTPPAALAPRPRTKAGITGRT